MRVVFRQQGISTLPARICNLHDISRAPVGPPLDSALDLPQRHCCCSITKPSTPKEKVWYPCHVQNDMYVWFHAVTAEGNGPVVIKFLQTHRRWYIEDCRVERRASYAAANPRYTFLLRVKRICDRLHVNLNNGVSVIIIPQGDWVPFHSFLYSYQLRLLHRVWTSLPWKSHHA